MGLGDILGSLSPAFGMASGQGMFGNLGGFGQSGMGGLLGLLMSGGSSPAPQSAAATMLPGTNIPAPQVAPSLPGPGIGQFAASMPQLGSSGGGPLGALGSALQSGQKQDPGLGPTQAPGLVAPHGSALLQAILGDQTPTSGGLGLHEILMRLGAIRQ